jgi:hypothetical protein
MMNFTPQQHSIAATVFLVAVLSTPARADDFPLCTNALAICADPFFERAVRLTPAQLTEMQRLADRAWEIMLDAAPCDERCIRDIRQATERLK